MWVSFLHPEAFGLVLLSLALSVASLNPFGFGSLSRCDVRARCALSRWA